jgi:transcriptional regulator with XRE-family HTH domain
MRELDLSDAFAAVVKRHRTAHGLSKEALAQRAGLHQTYVGLLERCLRSPSVDTANALARALGVPLSDMIAEAEALSRRRTEKRG